MRDGLKIYACSGLCNSIGTAPAEFQYWRDDTVTTSNTQAVNMLLASLNQLEALLQYKHDITDEETLNALCLIDLYVVCLMFAEQYTQAELPLAGRVIGSMVEAGDFEFESLDDAERDEHLLSLCQTAEQRFLAADAPATLTNDFTTWFEQNITAKAKCGLSAEQQAAAAKFFEKQSGVGATGSNDASDLLFNAGEYYLYLYMTRQEAYKQSVTVGKKWDKQKEVYDYVHKCYDPIYGSKEAVDKIIYTGICKQLKQTPEYAVKQLTGHESKGIGIAAEVISAIAALITAIVAAISLLLQFVVQIVTVKYQSPVNAGSGTPEDYEWEEPESMFAGLDKKKIGIAAAVLLIVAKLFK